MTTMFRCAAKDCQRMFKGYKMKSKTWAKKMGVDPRAILVESCPDHPSAGYVRENY